MPLWVKVGLWFGGNEVKEGVKKGWAAVDGKKTVIGLVLTFLVAISPEVHDLAIGLGVSQQSLLYVTTGIAVVGALHKVWKKFFGANA
jgi:hypothetical protein